MKKVYICSPYHPIGKNPEKELEYNLNLVKKACRLAISKGYMPLAPHLYFTQILSDDNPDERQKGINLGLEWLNAVSEVWIIGNRISVGMQQEIDVATEQGIPVIHMGLDENDKNI